MTEQPKLATLGLIAVSIVAIIAVVVVWVQIGKPPTGLIAVASAAVTGLSMASGRRRV